MLEHNFSNMDIDVIEDLDVDHQFLWNSMRKQNLIKQTQLLQ